MKSQTKYRKLIALFVLAVMLRPICPHRAEAFTLIETQFLPAVQLGAAQTVLVAASNLSAAPVSVTIEILNSVGTIVITRTSSIPANKTLVVKFTNGTTTGSYSAVVGANAASAINSDFQVLSSNGQVAAVALPYIELPAVQATGSVRLIPGQSALAAITNFATTSTQFTLTVTDNFANTVMTETQTLAAGQTMTFKFSNKGTASNGYRAVVASAANAVIGGIVTLDSKTGLVSLLVYPPNPCAL
jgi:hypothetical protein